MKKVLILLSFTAAISVFALERKELFSLIEEASLKREFAYVEVRNKIVELGTSALPLLADLAVDESLSWQKQLVSRICYERIERKEDIEKLLATDWYNHPDFEARWNLLITGPEGPMRKLVIADMKKAELWYYYLEIIWKMINEDGKIFKRSDPENWAGSCTLAVKDNPEERIWFLRICSEFLKDTPDLDPSRSRAGWMYSVLFKEEKTDAKYLLEHRAPPPVTEEPPFRLGTNIIKRAKQP